jgi:hypothetical protein
VSGVEPTPVPQYSQLTLPSEVTLSILKLSCGKYHFAHYFNSMTLSLHG